MLIDARTVPPETRIETDLCIIGGGVAGITLSRALSGAPFRICLLESGGFDLEYDAQELYAGQTTGLPYTALNAARLRYFGGTSNHWAGWCRPLDPFDFEPHEWIPYSGWPFGRAELDPYYDRAFDIVETGPGVFGRAEHPQDTPPGFPGLAPDVHDSLFWLSEPTRFGKRYREDVLSAPNVDLYLHANVIELRTNPAASQVTHVQVATLGGSRFTVGGRLFILATGGIENARLLLASNAVQKEGLANAHDLVGRFFMDHPGVHAGSVLLSDPHVALGYYASHVRGELPQRKLEGVGALTFSDQVLRDHRMVNCALLVREAGPWDAWGLQALGHAVKDVDTEYIGSALRTLIVNLDTSLIDVYTRFINTDVHRPLVRLITILAPTPNPDSRVTLLEEKDPLGVPRVRLDWRLGPIDKSTVWRAHDVLGRALGAAGLGRLFTPHADDTPSWPATVEWELEHGWHHMGTTRMHNDPRQGVVDARCRVHGIDNLCVAGSSVFPTYGYSQPTLTIVALALRMAEDVRKTLR